MDEHEIYASEFRITANSVAIRMAIDAFRSDPVSSLRGDPTFSVETSLGPDHSAAISAFILSDPRRFLALARTLPPFIEDSLLQYYLLGRTQTQIGSLLGTTQDVISAAVSLGTRALAAKACRRRRGLRRLWHDMRTLQRRRERDRRALRLRAPAILGRFRVRTLDPGFDAVLAPETINGSIVRALST